MKRLKKVKKIIVMSLVFFLSVSLYGCGKKNEIDENLVGMWAAEIAPGQSEFLVELYKDGTYQYYSDIRNVSGITKCDKYTGTWGVNKDGIELKSSETGKLSTATYNDKNDIIEVISSTGESETPKQGKYSRLFENTAEAFRSILNQE